MTFYPRADELKVGMHVGRAGSPLSAEIASIERTTRTVRVKFVSGGKKTFKANEIVTVKT